MNRWFIGWLLLVAAAALLMRLSQLDQRPMHADESVHAIKFKSLFEAGQYKYDPNEYHGPSLYYFTLPLVKLSSARTFAQTTEANYRLVTVLFGVGIILIFGLMADALGKPAAICGAALSAFSPAMVFYSRYFIHEMLLVFFTALLFGAIWRYSRAPGWGWALLAGASLGLMFATKETFVFSLVALAISVVLAWFLGRLIDGRAFPLQKYGRWPHMVAATTMALLVAVVFFSSFFTNASGPLDSLRTFLPWLGRAQGQSPHVHPWSYYLSLLLYTHRAAGPVFSEALILALAVVGLIAALRGKGLGHANVTFLRITGIYTVILTLIYSAIPYKTPWCLLTFLYGMILLAGVGATWLIQSCRTVPLKALISIILLACTAQLGWQAYLASYRLSADQRNPYVYAHTAPDLLNLVDQLDRLARVHVKGHKMVVKVMANGGDYWPLPWYLRGFDRVGYYPRLSFDAPAADAIVVSPGLTEELEAKLGKNVAMCGFFGLRPSVFLELYVESNFWNYYLQHRPPEEN